MEKPERVLRPEVSDRLFERCTPSAPAPASETSSGRWLGHWHSQPTSCVDNLPSILSSLQLLPCFFPLSNQSLFSFHYYWYKYTLLCPLLLLACMWLRGCDHPVWELLSGEANSPFNSHQWCIVLCLWAWGGCKMSCSHIYTSTDTAIVPALSQKLANLLLPVLWLCVRGPMREGNPEGQL